jgi:hypothetical protein
MGSLARLFIVGGGLDKVIPCLFVLSANSLQTLMNKAKYLNLLKLPISLECSTDFPIIQYADDILIIMEKCTRQLFFLRASYRLLPLLQA